MQKHNFLKILKVVYFYNFCIETPTKQLLCDFTLPIANNINTVS